MNGISAMVSQMMAHELPRKDIKARVIELSATMSQRAVAYEVGVSRTTVFNILRVHRVAKKKGRGEAHG